MGIGGIVQEVLLWPTIVSFELQSGATTAALVGVGAGALAAWYLFGFPSTDLPILTLAEQYAVVGVGVVVANAYLDASKK